jgi:hypothetical protein
MTGSRMLGGGIEREGPFRVRLTLQMNVTAGSYLIEVSAHDAITQQDIAVAPSLVAHVTNPGTFVGTVSFNPSLAVVGAT